MPKTVLRATRGAVVAALLALPLAAPGGEAAELRRTPEQDPQAEWRSRQQGEEAARQRIEDQRENWLERQRVDPDGPGERLNEQLDQQWERQRELRDGRAIGPPLPEAGRLLRPRRW